MNNKLIEPVVLDTTCAAGNTFCCPTNQDVCNVFLQSAISSNTDTISQGTLNISLSCIPINL